MQVADQQFATSLCANPTILSSLSTNQRGLERFQKQLERHNLLVLDELGYVPFTKTGAELLFDVVSRAYERTSLIVTTNLPFENWTEVMDFYHLEFVVDVRVRAAASFL